MKLTGRFAWILVLVGFSLLLIAPHSQASDWVNKQKMRTARAFAGVGVVNGQLVVAGGLRKGAITPKVEAYSPWSDTWTTLRTLPTARKVWGSAAVGLNNKLYLIGGYTSADESTPTKMLTIYNPSTNSWSTGTDLPAACAPKGAAAVVNNKIYVLVKDSDMKKFIVFDPASPGTTGWDTTPATPLSSLAFKDYATVQAIDKSATDKKIYVIGGLDGANSSQEVEVFDVINGTWSQKADMTTARRSLASGVLNGRLYAIGGYSDAVSKKVEVYNPTGPAWSPGADLTYARFGLGAGVINGTLYAVGGQADAGNPNSSSTKLEAYTPVTVNVSILAPTWSSSVGQEWVTDAISRWAVILRLIYQTSNVEETGMTVATVANGGGSIPGLVVLVPTGDATVPDKNWADKFNITAVNSIGLNQVEVLAVWYVDDVDAPNLGNGVDASIYAAVTEEPAPAAVNDANGDGLYTADLTALWLASNVAQVDFTINSTVGDLSIKKKK